MPNVFRVPVVGDDTQSPPASASKPGPAPAVQPLPTPATTIASAAQPTLEPSGLNALAPATSTAAARQAMTLPGWRGPRQVSGTGSFEERDRRWRALHAAMLAEGYDALVFAGADYRGHKGSLRYVADYNLAHRYGYAVMFAGEAPIMVLPQNLTSGRRPATAWVEDYRYPYNLGDGLAEIIAGRKSALRIGIVGMGQVMKVEDFLKLQQALPDRQLLDAGATFERVRAIKSAAELEAVKEGAYILDRCFDRLLEVARPGLTERAISAEMYRTAAMLGGEDPLFLTMYADLEPTGPVPTFGVPRDRELGPTDLLCFSYEIVGPSGYWVEFSRMVTFAEPSDPVARMARAVSRGIHAASNALKPGSDLADAQQALLAAIEAEGTKTSYWSGHGMGLDVLEEPWVGLDVVQDGGDERALTTAADGMVLAIHPTPWDEKHGTMGYMSESFVITDGACRSLSDHPVQLYRV